MPTREASHTGKAAAKVRSGNFVTSVLLEGAEMAGRTAVKYTELGGLRLTLVTSSGFRNKGANGSAGSAHVGRFNTSALDNRLTENRHDIGAKMGENTGDFDRVEKPALLPKWCRCCRPESVLHPG